MMIKKKYKICVIAWKYNDIYYALSTPIFKQIPKEERLLIYFAKNNLAGQSFPLMNLFGKCINLNWHDSNMKNIYALFHIICTLFNYIAETITLSNPYLVVNMLVTKILAPQKIILLEDGLMNYYKATPYSYRTKNFAMKTLGLSYNVMENLISETYLWNPSISKFYFGNLQKLNIGYLQETLHNNRFVKLLDGKSIFIDTPLYKDINPTITKDRYIKIVKWIIEKYQIDYYLPHAFSDMDVKFDIPYIDIYSEQLTLELLASNCNFKLYSLSSTLLISCRFINESIYSCFMDIGILNSEKKELLKINSSDYQYISLKDIDCKYNIYD